MNDELTKRKNPFEAKRTPIVEEESIEETFSPEEEQEIEEEPVKVVSEPVARPTYAERSTVRTAKPTKILAMLKQKKLQEKNTLLQWILN